LPHPVVEYRRKKRLAVLHSSAYEVLHCYEAIFRRELTYRNGCNKKSVWHSQQQVYQIYLFYFDHTSNATALVQAIGRSSRGLDDGRAVATQAWRIEPSEGGFVH
jgi:hypothetical protein